MNFAGFPFKDAFRLLTTANGRRVLWLFLRYGKPKHATLTRVKFGAYTFQVPDVFAFIWQLKEIFADSFYVFPAGNEPLVIFDCGANVGVSVVYFHQYYPNARIVAFEADPEIAKLLVQNLRQSRIESATIVEKAVWINTDGINIGGTDSDAASVFATDKVRHVPSVRLRDWLLNEPRIDMLKIDIEGAEIAVIADCADALTTVQHLFVEFHAYPGHPQALAQLLAVLEQAGFRYYIDTSQQRRQPFVNRQYRNNPTMDLQLNIFAYRPH